MKDIVIKGAREHNLKNINLEIPRDNLIVITGISGSGKSTLAFDTIYAESHRRFVESLSSYARQFLGLMDKPDVDSITGLSPSISIDQKTTSKNPRSTVGTITEIYDHLRLLFARIGTPYCPTHKIQIKKQTAQTISNTIFNKKFKEAIILAPIIIKKKGTYEKLFQDLVKKGYIRARVNSKIKRLDEEIKLDRYKMHTIEVVVDRLQKDDEFSRLNEAVETALKLTDNLIIANLDGTDEIFSSKMTCPKCDEFFEELQPRMFSFNSPFGACKACHGLGVKMEFDENLIIPDKNLSIADGAIKIYRNAIDGWRGKYIGTVAKNHGFDVFTKIKDLNKEQLDVLFYGSKKNMKFILKSNSGENEWRHNGKWEGLIPQSKRLYSQTESDYRRKELEKFMRVDVCPKCNGTRLKEKIHHVKINEKSIIDINNMSIDLALNFFENIKLKTNEKEISKQILKEIISRLSFLKNVGLSYLTLSRSSTTLSGGEAQRIRLATQIGSNLTGVLYILDEPSIGLHQKDNQKLINTLFRLKNLGNTLIIVEHDEETIKNADFIVDMGPGAGIHGGEVIFSGNLKQLLKHKTSLTAKYMNKEMTIKIPKKRRKPIGLMKITGCKQNNLKNIDVNIPLGVFNVITGVSGSGKSTLVHEIIYKGLLKKEIPGLFKTIEFKDDVKIDKVIVIDQSPIGKTPRSNPATYTKVFDEIRKLFSLTKQAKEKGYAPGRFSFNVYGGRCEACSGDGVKKIEMNFLPDVYIKCEECKGKRYNLETLKIKYKEKNISDVLEMSVDEAYSFFLNIPLIKNKLSLLKRVGLGYIKLGQSSTTLSGGESQRIKITRELSKRSTGNTLYLLDEPTTGLHFHDVKKLLSVLNELVEKKNTVIVIEHNLDIIKSADNIIDLGPEGGDKGGYIVCDGTPEEVLKVKESYTGEFLKKIIK